MICNVRDTFYGNYTLNVYEGPPGNYTEKKSGVLGEPFQELPPGRGEDSLGWSLADGNNSSVVVQKEENPGVTF